MELKIKRRRKHFLNQYGLAKKQQDGDYQKEMGEEIKRFNEKQPSVAITQKTLEQSIKTSKRYSDSSLHGVKLDKSLRHLSDEVRF